MISKKTEELKSVNCPNCNSSNIAEIIWGLPRFTPELAESLKKKEIVAGGCTITGNDPKWECNDCNHRWGNAEHNDDSDKTDSFDYDQGFNLDEVYDQ